MLRSGEATPAGPLDWVLEKIPADQDDWLAERASEALGKKLRELAVLLERLDLTEASLAPFLDRSVLAEPGIAGRLATTLEEGGLTTLRAEREGKPELLPASAADIAREIREELGGVVRIEKAKFKVFRVQRENGPAALVRIRSLLEADGVDASGHRLQTRAVWDSAWRLAGESQLLVELRPVLLERARLAGSPFRDVAAAALGSSSSWHRQLLVGLEAWRTRIDSASGLDIYGHQGISVGDYDGDGLEDLHVSQPAGLPNLLFHNQGDGTFKDVTGEAGVGVLDGTGGALFLDLDGDEDLDLVVVTALEILLFENVDRRHFMRRTATGLEGTGKSGSSSMSCAAADYDRDGDLDLYCVSYVFWAGAGSRTHSSYPYPYHDANNGAPNFLFRNEGQLRFRNVTVESGLDVNNRRFSLAAAWADPDDDGDQDLYVANDFGRNNFYQNQGDGTFRDVAAEAGVEDTGNGMSVAWEDYDQDGRIDLYVGNMWSSAGGRLVDQPGYARIGDDLQAVYRRMSRGNSLFRNLGNGRFADVTDATRTAFGRWAWSCAFIDYDSNGREDLYVSNGFVTNEGEDDL